MRWDILLFFSTPNYSISYSCIALIQFHPICGGNTLVAHYSSTHVYESHYFLKSHLELCLLVHRSRNDYNVLISPFYLMPVIYNDISSQCLTIVCHLQLNLLSTIRHENLVPLLGYCNEKDQEILVYPFMSNGSLQDRLYGTAHVNDILLMLVNTNCLLKVTFFFNTKLKTIY